MKRTEFIKLNIKRKINAKDCSNIKADVIVNSLLIKKQKFEKNLEKKNLLLLNLAFVSE